MSKVLILSAWLSFLGLVMSNATTAESFSENMQSETEHPQKMTTEQLRDLFLLSLPHDSVTPTKESYEDVRAADLNSDGEWELILSLNRGDVNVCSQVLQYNQNDGSFSEWHFAGGGLCNYTVRGDYLISSYRDHAIWHQDIYKMASGKPELYITDSCVGCDEVRRKTYRPDGTPVKTLVSDDIDFEKRIPLKAKITTGRARIFSSADQNCSTKKYLIRGDEITLLDYYRSPDDTDWAQFRFDGPKTITEGWLRYSDFDR